MKYISLLFSILISCYVIWTLAHAMGDAVRDKINKTQVKYSFNLKMFFHIISTFIIMCLCIFVLSTLFPILKWSWTQYIFQDSTNIAFAPIQTAQEMRQVMDIKPAFDIKRYSWISDFIMLFFFLLIGMIMPRFAYQEELIFRKHHIRLSKRIKQSIKFGLAHCIVGVPLYAGFGLIIPGLLFAYIYKKTYQNAFIKNLKDISVPTDDEKILVNINKAKEEAIKASTSYHLLWNWSIISIPILYAIYNIVSKIFI